MQLVSISNQLHLVFLSLTLETAGIDDDIQRRDSLHALINNLPDAHYATMRALILVRYMFIIHLHFFLLNIGLTPRILAS